MYYISIHFTIVFYLMQHKEGIRFYRITKTLQLKLSHQLNTISIFLELKNKISMSPTISGVARFSIGPLYSTFHWVNIPQQDLGFLPWQNLWSPSRGNAEGPRQIRAPCTQSHFPPLATPLPSIYTPSAGRHFKSHAF